MAGRIPLTILASVALAVAACSSPAATPTPGVTTPAPSDATGASSPTAAPSAATTADPDGSAGAGTPAPGTSPSAPATSLVPFEDLEGREWVLALISNGSLLDDVPPGITATITLEGGIAKGTSGCNTFAGPYLLDVTSIVFGDLVLTTKVCDDGAMALEANYIAALEAVARYGERGSGMAFFSPSGVPVLIYVEASTAPLVGDWTVTAYQNAGGAIVPPVEGTPLTLTFADDGTLSGSDGCNTFTGTYTTDGPRIAMSGFSGSRTACSSDELADQEEQYLAALQASVLSSASETGLSLWGEDAILTVSLSRTGGG